MHSATLKSTLSSLASFTLGAAALTSQAWASNVPGSAPSSAAAQYEANTSPLPDFITRAGANDNPLSVGLRFINSPPPAASLQRFFKHNQVSPSAVTKTVAPSTVFKVPMDMIDSSPGFVKVLALKGKAFVRLKDSTQDTPLAVGSVIPESATVSTRSQSTTRLGLPDGSVMSVLDNSSLQFSKLRQLMGTDIFQIEVSQVLGRLETKVSPLKSAAASFNIRSPRTVTGVRGTQFNVSDYTGQNAVVEVPEGAVALQDQGARSVALPAGYGSYITAASASDAIPLLAPPQLVKSYKQLPAGDVTLGLFQPGSATTRMDIARADNPTEALTYTQTAQAAWPAALSQGEYLATVRSVDANGLHGYAQTLKITGSEALNRNLEPRLKWVADMQSLVVDANATAYALEIRPNTSLNKVTDLNAIGAQGAQTALSSKLNTTTEYPASQKTISLESLPSGKHLVRVANKVTDARTGQQSMGYFSPWVQIYIP